MLDDLEQQGPLVIRAVGNRQRLARARLAAGHPEERDQPGACTLVVDARVERLTIPGDGHGGLREVASFTSPSR